MAKVKIVNATGARPNFMKIAPLTEAYRRKPPTEPLLVHTGQRYDEHTIDLFFRQMGIPGPDLNLDVGPGPHGAQTARIVPAFEPLVAELKPTRCRSWAT